MRIGAKIILSFLIVAGLGFYLLIDWIVDDLSPRYRESTEEPLVDFATVLAAELAVSAKDGTLVTEPLRAAMRDALGRSFKATIYNIEKTAIDLRVYVTDSKGIVLYDSANGRDEGQDYSKWRDVSLTLSGEYGARTSRDNPDIPASTMYVAAPVIQNGKTIGVVSVGKPTATANQLVNTAQHKIFNGGMLVCAAVVLLAALLSHWVTSPIRVLTEYARAVRDGRRVGAPELGSGEISELGKAFVEMKEALEGKQYVEKYVQTLTHEVKSPLSGIKGAVELLKEDLPSDKRSQFLGNIERETTRLQKLVERLLGLSTLQRRGELGSSEKLSLQAIAKQLVEEHQAAAQGKGITLSFEGESSSLVMGDRFWLTEALSHLLQNALDFTPRGGVVKVKVSEQQGQVTLAVEDSGTGIPEWAKTRVFEQFYSLPRPDSGKKSTGLGLPLVKEVAELHGGFVTLENRQPSGAVATVTLRCLSGKS